MPAFLLVLGLLLALPAAAQSTDPLDAFTRLRTSDPGFGPSNQWVGNCFDCHSFTRSSATEPGGHGNVYRSATWILDTDTGLLDFMFRFPPTPSVLPQNYRIQKHSPPALFGDALLDPVLGTISDQDIITSPSGFGRPHLLNSSLHVGRYGAAGCCRTLECAIREALARDFNISHAEQASQTIHAPSGKTWEQFYDDEVALLLANSFFYTIPPPEVHVGLEAKFDSGAAVFDAIGCNDCHRHDGDFPYSDLRLHLVKGKGKGVKTCPGTLTDPQGWEVMTPSLISRRNFLGRDMNTNPSVKQDVIRNLHNIDEARDSVEQYLQLSDPDRSDLDYFLDRL